MKYLKTIHLAVGILGLVAFILTGQYMSIFLGGLADMADGPRLLYRTSHLYLMWSALANLLIGCYFVVSARQGIRTLQIISSIALLAGPPLMLTAFFTDAHLAELQRPYSGAANILALGGVLLHVIANFLPHTVKSQS